MAVKAHECYHCKQWVEEDEPHDCWTTTEKALTKDLSDDLQDAYQRIRETAVEFGEQRIYASHHSIMFSRKACHFLVKPRRNFLEFWIFLGRVVKGPQIKKVVESSRVKRAHLLKITHRDEIDSPITDWMKEAYQLQDSPALARKTSRATAKQAPKRAMKAKKARR
jgi:Domain of unknown function (DUF5655)